MNKVLIAVIVIVSSSFWISVVRSQSVSDQVLTIPIETIKEPVPGHLSAQLKILDVKTESYNFTVSASRAVAPTTETVTVDLPSDASLIIPVLSGWLLRYGTESLASKNFHAALISLKTKGYEQIDGGIRASIGIQHYFRDLVHNDDDDWGLFVQVTYFVFQEVSDNDPRNGGFRFTRLQPREFQGANRRVLVGEEVRGRFNTIPSIRKVHTLRGWYLGYGGKLRDSISETFWQPVPPTPGFNQGVLSESPPQEHRLSELAMMVNVTRPGVHSPSILKIDPSLWEFGHNHAMTFGTEIDLMSLQEGFPGGILGRDFYTVVGLSHLIVRSGNRSRGDRAEEILVRTVAPSGTDVAISVLKGWSLNFGKTEPEFPIPNEDVLRLQGIRDRPWGAGLISLGKINVESGSLGFPTGVSQSHKVRMGLRDENGDDAWSGMVIYYVIYLKKRAFAIEPAPSEFD